MTLLAAHVVTSEAVALGDPEIIVMTRDEGMGADEIERIPLDNDDKAVQILQERGYRCPGVERGMTQVQRGYWIFDVERD